MTVPLCHSLVSANAVRFIIERHITNARSSANPFLNFAIVILLLFVQGKRGGSRAAVAYALGPVALRPRVSSGLPVSLSICLRALRRAHRPCLYLSCILSGVGNWDILSFSVQGLMRSLYSPYYTIETPVFSATGDSASFKLILVLHYCFPCFQCRFHHVICEKMDREEACFHFIGVNFHVIHLHFFHRNPVKHVQDMQLFETRWHLSPGHFFRPFVPEFS